MGSRRHQPRGREVSGERETVPGEKVKPPGETLIWLFLLVGLAIYLGDRMKTMVGTSNRDVSGRLGLVRPPIRFPLGAQGYNTRVGSPADF